VLGKNEVEIYGALVFPPDYSATLLTAKMGNNSNEQSMYIIFQWSIFVPSLLYRVFKMKTRVWITWMHACILHQNWIEVQM